MPRRAVDMLLMSLVDLSYFFGNDHLDHTAPQSRARSNFEFALIFCKLTVRVLFVPIGNASGAARRRAAASTILRRTKTTLEQGVRIMEKELPVDFLTTVYEKQFDSLRTAEDAVVARVNLYMTIVSALLGALLFIAQGVGFSNIQVNFTICAIMAIVLLIGLIIYAEITQWVIVVVRAHQERAILQNLLLEHHQEIVNLLHPMDPKLIKLATHRRSFIELLNVSLGPKQIVTILNNSLGASILILTSISLKANTTVILLTTITAFFFVWLLQFLYSRMRYRFAHKLDSSNTLEQSIKLDEPENLTIESSSEAA